MNVIRNYRRALRTGDVLFFTRASEKHSIIMYYDRSHHTTRACDGPPNCIAVVLADTMNGYNVLLSSGIVTEVYLSVTDWDLL